MSKLRRLQAPLPLRKSVRATVEQIASAATADLVGGRRHVRVEQVITRVAPGAVSVTDHLVTTGWADPVRALAGTLDPTQLSTAETLYRLWWTVTRAGGRTIGAYDAASTGGGAAEPEMTDAEAEAHARLVKGLRSMGRAGIAAINAVCYGIVERTIEQERELRAALDVARPHLLLSEAHEAMCDAIDDLQDEARGMDGEAKAISLGEGVRAAVRLMRALGVRPVRIKGKDYYLTRVGSLIAHERAEAELGVSIAVYDGKVASLRGAWIVPADLGE